ncbi:MAG: hypothetical protein U1F22_11630 [Lysobacterales bacterium]
MSIPDLYSTAWRASTGAFRGAWEMSLTQGVSRVSNIPSEALPHGGVEQHHHVVGVDLGGHALQGVGQLLFRNAWCEGDLLAPDDLPYRGEEAIHALTGGVGFVISTGDGSSRFCCGRRSCRLFSRGRG